MILRRFAAVLTWLLLLRVNVVANDLVCARHHTGASAVGAEMAHHAMHGRTNHATESGTRCKIPARSDCCGAMASCAVTIGAAASTHTEPPPVARVALTNDGGDAPAMPALSPEPPPPKA